MFGQLHWTDDFPLRIAIPFAFWLFCCGACIGSFLNVVVYRLPRGKNLSRPRSSCPACDQRIRWYDNIPILSWIHLKGRCRNCKEPIAIRYLLVEGIVASSFMLLGMAEPITGGSVLPESYKIRDLDIWMIFLAHLALLTTLLGAGLVYRDHGRVPARLFSVLLVILVVAQLVAPDFYPQPAAEGAPRGISLLAGLAAGVLAGGLLYGLERLLCGRSSRAVVISLAIVGMVVGWQLTSAALAMVALGYLPLQLAVGRQRPLPVLLFTAAATLLLIVRWRWWLEFIL
jgi:leader peptidase (prepilin peptidase)/N-methyltransferase